MRSFLKITLHLASIYQLLYPTAFLIKFVAITRYEVSCRDLLVRKSPMNGQTKGQSTRNLCLAKMLAQNSEEKSKASDDSFGLYQEQMDTV